MDVKPPYRATGFLVNDNPPIWEMIFPDEWPLPYPEGDVVDLPGCITARFFHKAHAPMVPADSGVMVWEFPEEFAAVIEAGTWAGKIEAMYAFAQHISVREYGDLTPLPVAQHAK